jgi:hypothetical protein
MALDKDAQAKVMLAAVAKGSAVEPEAAYYLARLQAGRPTSPAAFSSVAKRFPGTSWGEEALLDAAAYYARSGSDESLPYYRRIYEGYPQGKYIDPPASGSASPSIAPAASTRRPRSSKPRPGRATPTCGAPRSCTGRAGPAARPGRRTAGRRSWRRSSPATSTRTTASAPARRSGAVPSGASSTHPAPAEGLPVVPEPYRTRVRNLLLIERLQDGDGRARPARRPAPPSRPREAGSSGGSISCVPPSRP